MCRAVGEALLVEDVLLVLWCNVCIAKADVFFSTCCLSQPSRLAGMPARGVGSFFFYGSCKIPKDLFEQNMKDTEVEAAQKAASPSACSPRVRFWLDHSLLPRELCAENQGASLCFGSHAAGLVPINTVVCRVCCAENCLTSVLC